MKFRILALTLLLVACTRSVNVSPIAPPPVTLIPTPSGSPAAVDTETPPPALAATPMAAPASDRLPAGTPAADPIPAPGAWAIWRQGTDAGLLYRADASGKTVEVRLPALDGTRPSPEYALSPDGRLVFYTLLDAGGGVIARHLAAYEFATGRLQTAPLDLERYDLVDYGTLQAAFEPGGTRVAVTLEGFPENDNTKTSFQVYLWDLKSNKYTEPLTPETSFDRDLLPKDHTPLVIRWMPEGILLAGHLYQSPTYSKTLLWNVESGKITAAPDASADFAFRGQRVDGGVEVAWPDYAEAYPTLPLDCWGAQTPDNVVKLLNLDEGKTRVIFAAGASEQIGQVRWLDGGERLALLMIGCDKKATRLLALNRQGGVSETVPVAGDLALFGSGGELIFVQESLETNTTAIIAYDGARKWAAREVAAFSGTLGSAGYAFRFVAEATARAGLDPFPDVGPETSRSGLEIGKRATVSSSSGVLNIRTEPNPDAPALGLLPAGSEVTILDGPVKAANDLVYWKVEADNGLVGWCVESVEGEQTLIPKP